MAARAVTREPAANPARTELPVNNTSCTVAFRHPAYPDFLDQNVLLTLYAWDAVPRGLHAQTALLACTILAANAPCGYLAVRNTQGRLEPAYADTDPEDTLLTLSEYYFVVPPPEPATEATYKYPVCPSFRDWVFSSRLQQRFAHWQTASPADAGDDAASVVTASSATAAVLARDHRRCLLSRCGDYVQRAHLCPRAETEWFMRNRMVTHNVNINLSGDSITDDLANAITLRGDIHSAFDDCRFVFVPKAGAWVPHFLDPTVDLGPVYHNTRVDLSAQVSKAFLLARFAWALFPKMRHFFESGPLKAVHVLEESEDGLQLVYKEMRNSDALMRAQAAGRGRSASPKKRKAEQSTTLPSATETKRARHAATRISVDAAARCSTPEDEDAAEAARFAQLKRSARAARRPRDPAMLCCDYARAEHLNSLGVPGKPEFGGGHLCWQCLGGEDVDGEWRGPAISPLTPPLSHGSETAAAVETYGLEQRAGQ